jgi:hypothetical protein
MVIAMTLLMNGLTQVPAIQLLPGYVVAYLLIGAFIFGPVGRMPSPRQSAAFLLPGVLLVMVAFLDFGFWCGGSSASRHGDSCSAGGLLRTSSQ